MQPDTVKALSRLTPQQRRVFTLLGSGLTSREVAQSMRISTKTMDCHMGAAYARTNLTRDALVAAVSEGKLGDYIIKLGRWHEEYRNTLTLEANQVLVQILADMRSA